VRVGRRYARKAEVSQLEADLAGTAVRFEARQSMGADVATQVLEEVAATLVVVGTRRRSSTGKPITASVAQPVLLGAGRTVLAVTP